jgi:DNA polymerase elongation subunit (family B)
MNLEIRKNRDYSKTMSFKQLWLQEQFQKLRKVYDPTEVSNDELKKLLLSEYDKRRVVTGRMYSNTTNKNEVMTQEQFIDYFLNKPLILSGYSTLYENQDNSTNIGSAALKFLLDSRKTFKKKMEESEYGSDQYIYYRILQLTFKVLANSYYGILGERNSVFYNPHVQNSITMTGQDLITTSIISLENYLADNVNFDNFDDCLTFINESLSEKIDDQILKYLDEPVLHSELIDYLRNKTTNFDDSMDYILSKTVNRLSLEDVNRLYYKNKTLKFISNTWVKNTFFDIIQKLNSVTDENDESYKTIKVELDKFSHIVKTFTFSNMIFEDRFKRVMKMNRKNVVVSDTDSAFINLSNYIQESFKILNVDNNDNNELIIMNIYIDIVTKALDDTMKKITENMGLLEEYKPIINLKNEFVYKRIMLTRNKKSKQHCSFKIFLIAGNPLSFQNHNAIRKDNREGLKI